ncbi:DUF1365 family protein, partial [Vibrio parahaemolyticus]|nr:DUF1365 family protein [Vibrio parahaemolyticus]
QLLIGNVRQRRCTPGKHELNYSMCMPAIDLDDIGLLEKKVGGFGTRGWHWDRFQRDDYLGDRRLKKPVQDKGAALTGERCS